MTGAIIYTSEDDFEPDYKAELIAEAAALAKDHIWWNQSLNFADNPSYPDALDGATQLTHRYFEDESGKQRKIPYRDDMLMAMVDYSQIIGILAALSNAHEFDWNLCYPAAPRAKQIGMIQNGEIDPRIFEFLIHEMQALKISDADLENESLHAQIRSQYFTPSGEKIFD
ncbi:MAG: hypothetical protein AAGB46_06630 [Verrucomicrobiota bacterium]